MSVRNCPSPRLDGKHLWLYIERAHLGFKLRRRSPPLGGAADTFSKVWPGLWSASVCNIYVLNGLLLHIEGCMILGVYKLENNHVLSLLEIVCPGICTLSPPRWTKPRSSHPHISDIFFFLSDHAECTRSRGYIYFIGTSVYVTVPLHGKLVAFPALYKTRWNRSSAHGAVRESSGVSQSPYFHPSVFWDEYLWRCSIFSE